MPDNSTYDADYAAYMDDVYGVGMPCEFGTENVCPPRQTCEEAAVVYECNGECTEAWQVDRCRCWEFFGHEGDTCQELTANSYISATFFAVGAIISMVALYWNVKTLVPVASQLMSGKMKMNIATSTLFLSATASVITAMISCAYVTSTLQIDQELDFERYWIGPLFGILAVFMVPATLLVCTMWIDVASAGMKRTKAQRNAMANKIRCGMVTASIILAVLFALLAILDMRSFASFLCVVVFIVVGVLYKIGGHKLSTMLASEGASKPEGIFGTCKPGTTPGMIVVNTATNISLCCFSNIIGGVIYVVAPNPLSSLGVMIMFVTMSGVLLVIVLYLRFGLRKALNISFDLEKGSDKTQTAATTATKTKDETKDEPNPKTPTKVAQVAPA